MSSRWRVRTRAITSRRWLVAGLAVAVVGLAAAVAFLVLRDPYPTSAQFGHEGTRTFDRAPDDLPAGIVPPDAQEVEGTAARKGTSWTAAVSFVVNDSRDAVQTHVDAIVTARGYVFRQRSYDDITLHVFYDGEDGSVLSVTYQTVPEGTGTAIVLQGSAGPADV